MPPLRRDTMAAILAVPDTEQLDPTDAAQVQVAWMSPVGGGSLTVAPTTAAGPWLVTTMV
jgi:hypothetical protein